MRSTAVMILDNETIGKPNRSFSLFIGKSNLVEYILYYTECRRPDREIPAAMRTRTTTALRRCTKYGVFGRSW